MLASVVIFAVSVVSSSEVVGLAVDGEGFEVDIA
jgi:hypothetical protein